MRISVQLVKVTDGYQLWSESYDRTLQDIFAVQDDIAQSVVKELRGTLLNETVDAKMATQATAQVAAAVKGRANDAEAHRLYLQARHFIDRMTRRDIAKGIEYIDQALQREPTFALAWAELSRAYANEANYGWSPIAEGVERAREAVARALALEPDLAEGHAALGRIQLIFDWDWRGGVVRPRAGTRAGKCCRVSQGRRAGRKPRSVRRGDGALSPRNRAGSVERRGIPQPRERTPLSRSRRRGRASVSQSARTFSATRHDALPFSAEPARAGSQ